jgi:hypothetical protein
MNRYRLKVCPVVRAVRFDDPHKLPKYVHGIKGRFVLEVGDKKYLPIELGDYIVYDRDGKMRPLNYNTFVALYERIFDVDGEDVSDEYRPTGVEAQ